MTHIRRVIRSFIRSRISGRARLAVAWHREWEREQSAFWLTNTDKWRRVQRNRHRFARLGVGPRHPSPWYDTRGPLTRATEHVK
jgi:hypothetical protein